MLILGLASAVEIAEFSGNTYFSTLETLAELREKGILEKRGALYYILNRAAVLKLIAAKKEELCRMKEKLAELESIISKI